MLIVEPDVTLTDYGLTIECALFTYLLHRTDSASPLKSWFMFLFGIQLHYLARKCFLDEVVRTALHDGFSQVVIIGAGFDTLALRLASEFPATRFIEIDHPATQRYKQRTLEMRQAVCANMGFLDVDLTRQSIQERLSTSPFYRSEADTIFIAEGVLMYLTADEVAAIFRFMSGGGESKRRAAFTFMEPDSSGRPAFHNSNRAVDFWLRLRGEPFRWGIHRDDLTVFLESVGFSLSEIATPQIFRARYSIQEAPLAEGEYICVAGRRVHKSSKFLVPPFSGAH